MPCTTRHSAIFSPAIIRLLSGRRGERTTRIHRTTTDLSAVSEVDLAYISTQTNVHEELIEHIAPLLRHGRWYLLRRAIFFTAYFLKHCPDNDLTIIEGERSTIDCGMNDKNMVRVGFRNVCNPVGVYPVANVERVRDMLASMDFHYVFLPSVIEATLYNPNLRVHTVGAVTSIPRIEKPRRDYCMYWEVWTSSVYRILDALDQEKMNVFERFGYKRLNYFYACKDRNSLDDFIGTYAVFQEYAASPYRAKGPAVVDSH